MPWRFYCGLKPGEILGLKYDSFDLEAGTVTICGLHARNYVSADRNGGDNSQSLKYSGRKLRSDSNYRTVPVPEFLFDEIGERRYLNEGILLRYPGLAEEGALCLGPYGKVKTLPHTEYQTEKRSHSPMACPASPLETSDICISQILSKGKNSLIRS